MHITPNSCPKLPLGVARNGIFKHTDTQFDAVLRYSTSGGPLFESMPDHDEKQAVGLALKILDKNGNSYTHVIYINVIQKRFDESLKSKYIGWQIGLYTHSLFVDKMIFLQHIA